MKEDIKTNLGHTNKKNIKVVFVSQQSLDKIPSWLAIADYLYLSLRNASQFSNTVPAKLQVYGFWKTHNCNARW